MLTTTKTNFLTPSWAAEIGCGTFTEHTLTCSRRHAVAKKYSIARATAVVTNSGKSQIGGTTVPIDGLLTTVG